MLLNTDMFLIVVVVVVVMVVEAVVNVVVGFVVIAGLKVVKKQMEFFSSQV